MTEEMEEGNVKLARTMPSINISHLSGPEVERAASALGTSLSAGSLKVAIENADKISKMPIDEINRLRAMAEAAAANCGGYGCG